MLAKGTRIQPYRYQREAAPLLDRQFCAHLYFHSLATELSYAAAANL